MEAACPSPFVCFAINGKRKVGKCLERQKSHAEDSIFLVCLIISVVLKSQSHAFISLIAVQQFIS